MDPSNFERIRTSILPSLVAHHGSQAALCKAINEQLANLGGVNMPAIKPYSFTKYIKGRNMPAPFVTCVMLEWQRTRPWGSTYLDKEFVSIPIVANLLSVLKDNTADVNHTNAELLIDATIVDYDATQRYARHDMARFCSLALMIVRDTANPDMTKVRGLARKSYDLSRQAFADAKTDDEKEKARELMGKYKLNLLIARADKVPLSAGELKALASEVKDIELIGQAAIQRQHLTVLRFLSRADDEAALRYALGSAQKNIAFGENQSARDQLLFDRMKELSDRDGDFENARKWGAVAPLEQVNDGSKDNE